MTRPLVAIGGRRVRAGRVQGWPSAAMAVPDAYVNAIRRAGGREAILAPEHIDHEEARALLSRFDGLLLIGGGDIDPTWYGETRGRSVYGVDDMRDAFEVSLVRAALETRTPTLAICRGAQVLNVALGGTLEQDLGSLPDTLEHGDPTVGEHLAHDVRLERGSRVANATGTERVSACVSHHHQAVAKVAEPLVATGWADDEVIEAIEHPEGWFVGVQWHPEVTCGTDPVQHRLFESLVRHAADR